MFNWLLSRQLKKEAEYLDRRYHMDKLYYGMVKAAYKFMDKKQQQAWLELNDPKKTDACISLFYGSTEWLDIATVVQPRKDVNE